LVPGAEEIAILRDQIPRIVRGQPHDAGRVVELARDLARRRGGPDFGRVGTLIGPMLDACRELWDAEAVPLRPFELAAYWEASTAVSPLPPSPALEATWRAHDVTGEINDATVLFDHSESAFRLRRWLNLAVVIRANEPRFLAQVGFPDEFGDVWDGVIAAADDELGSDWLAPTADESQMWSETLSDAADRLEQCVDLNPALAARAEDLIAGLRQASDDKAETAREKIEAAAQRARELEWEEDDFEPGDSTLAERLLTVEEVMEDL
jgi:hypothetical protein